MKIHCTNQRNHGITLMETVIVVFVLVGLAIVFLPALAQLHRTQHYSNCCNNLKQIGLAFRIWAGDNNDKYPMSVFLTNGGAMEAVLNGNPK